MSDMFLYQELDTLKKVGKLKSMPVVINKNLSEHIKLRDYQVEAFQYFLTYFNTKELRKNKQTHLLFHMATGSGKTIQMAGLILYLYEQGYRNFLFFVNQKNIIEKTKENFLNENASKYLFKKEIEIDSKIVKINEVNNFNISESDKINISFMSTSKLHRDLSFPTEKSMSIEDFEGDPVVLISDESHHVNTLTKKSKAQIESESSWEYSVQRALSANKENILLEFTATADTKDVNLRAKYIDKIIYNYPLSEFRHSGYTKDFENLQTDYDTHWERTLVALIISEYRRFLFTDLGESIKPVVLLKSQYIKSSTEFYNLFYEKLKELSEEDILNLEVVDNYWLKEALNYFKSNFSSYHELIDSLKLSFSEERSLVMNSDGDITKEKQLLANTLEDRDNQIRLLFTVDMLNEGWDVLNLFDIVRLYDTRQSSGNKISPYTTKEAQLIGRGARYCPFKLNDNTENHKRKFDYDLDNPLRILETFIYHSKQNSRYIGELKRALKESGLLPEDAIELEYRNKESFKESLFFREGIIFYNKRIPKSRKEVFGVDKKISNLVSTTRLSDGRTSLFSLLDDEVSIKDDKKVKTFQYKLKDIPLSVLFDGISKHPNLSFDKLKIKYPHLLTTTEFLTSKDYLGNISIIIETSKSEINNLDLSKALSDALSKVSEHTENIKEQFYGTKEFYSKKVHEVIRDKKIRLQSKTDSINGLGHSQYTADEKIALDLSKADWYNYEDNFGTEEEKLLIKYFSQKVDKLNEVYDEVYLIRNERLAELAIYEFDTGERFEPDFLLFLRKKGEEISQQQIYIEPKGSDRLLQDSWKEKFLNKIEEESIPVIKYVDDVHYKIIGLPFFNEKERLSYFSQKFDKLV